MIRMKREFQIRVMDKNDGEIDVMCFESLAEANDVYNKGLQEDTEGTEYRWELIEVLRQDSMCNPKRRD